MWKIGPQFVFNSLAWSLLYSPSSSPSYQVAVPPYPRASLIVVLQWKRPGCLATWHFTPALGSSSGPWVRQGSPFKDPLCLGAPGPGGTRVF